MIPHKALSLLNILDSDYLKENAFLKENSPTVCKNDNIHDTWLVGGAVKQWLKSPEVGSGC